MRDRRPGPPPTGRKEISAEEAGRRREMCRTCPDQRACPNVACPGCGGAVEVHLAAACRYGRW